MIEFLVSLKFELHKTKVPQNENFPKFSVFITLFSPFPNVTWNKQDLEKLDSSTMLNSHTLRISPISEKIAGIYGCRWESEGDKGNWEIIGVTVHRLPTASMPPFKAVSVGETLEITCTVNGFPEPAVKYLINGVKSSGIFFARIFLILL